MQIRLPNFVYGPMPLIYIITGFFTCVLLKTVLAMISGVLLILAGIMALTHRYVTHRKTRKDHRKIILLKEQDKESSDLFLKLRWRKSYETGNFTIDEQHRKLYELGNNLVSKSIKQIDSDSIIEIRMLFENMKKHIFEHFKTEEEIISKINHPIYEKHKELHSSLLYKCELISRNLSKGYLPTRDILQFIVVDLIADHLRKDDMVFFDWLS